MEKMKLKDLCKDEMPREKMLSKGSEALSNSELLAILLRTGRNGKNVIDISRELLLSGDGSIAGLAQMSIDKLCEIDGIGPSKAVTICAVFEICKRLALENVNPDSVPISSPHRAFQVMHPIMANLDHEECWILFLSKTNRLIGKELISVGGMESTVIDNRPIIRKALEKKASGVILLHNHPSGSALPSHADITQTKMLNKALKTCDISLLDHIIICKNEYYSFADEQVIKNFDEAKNKDKFVSDIQ